MIKIFLFFLVCILCFTSCEEDSIENQILPDNIETDVFLNNPVIFDSKEVNIVMEKEDVKIDSLVVYLDEQILINQQNTHNVRFTFNPENYPTGEALIKVEVYQNGEISVSKQYPITIHRKLVEVELEDYFFQPNYQDYFVFASSADGSLLAAKKVESSPSSFILTTDIDIDKETPYSLTTASRFVSTATEIVHFNSVNDLTRSSFERFTPHSEKRRDIGQQVELSTSGFDENLIIRGTNSPGYSTGYDYLDFSFFLAEYNSLNSNLDYEDFYIRAQDKDNNEHTYMWVDKDALTSDFVINADNLTDEHLITGSIDVSYTDEYENGHNRFIEIKGYLDEDDFQSNNYHSIWLSGVTTQQAPDMFIRTDEPYVLNTAFHKYSHFLELEDYITNRIGRPLEEYQIPDWKIDFNIVDKQINFIATGSGHNVGRILVSSGNITDELPIIEGKKVLYLWNLNFDSINNDSLTLPELPNEIKGWSFGKFLDTSEPQVKWVRLERYEGINDYTDYLNSIIKNNNEPLNVSPVFEAKFKSNDDFNSFNSEPTRFFY